MSEWPEDQHDHDSNSPGALLAHPQLSLGQYEMTVADSPCDPVTGGALLPDGKLASDTDALEKLVGSFLIVKANSKEQVLDKLKGDVYYSSKEVVCLVRFSS